MSDKAEISWRRHAEDGEKLHVYARRFAGQWTFYARGRRYDQWAEQPQPPLEDWLELLDAVRRRINRRLLTPEEEQRVEREILKRYPAAKLSP